MGWFTWMFLGALALSVGVKFWLDARQRRAVLAGRESVPEAFRHRVSLEAHQKAADYTVAALAYARWDRLQGTGLVLFWTIGGGISMLDGFWRGYFANPLMLGVCAALSLYLIDWLAGLPFRYRTAFGLEERFGFNRSTRKTFVKDQVKLLALTIVLVTGLATSGLLLMQLELWWIWLWALWVGSLLMMMWAVPRWVMPLFNRITPLEDSALGTRVEALLQRCGFRSGGLFVMDGSRRSSRGNASFGGFGRSRRIILYDTLLDQLDEAEIEAVLAHELGHFRKRHQLQTLALVSLFGFGCAALLGWLHGQSWFYTQLGVVRASDHTAVLLFLHVAPVFLWLLRPLLTLHSRRCEFEADAFAAACSDGCKLAQGLVKAVSDNAATLTPDRLYSAFYHSHPPVPERVARLED
jgi:STE24 endopeptidase